MERRGLSVVLASCVASCGLDALGTAPVKDTGTIADAATDAPAEMAEASISDATDAPLDGDAGSVGAGHAVAFAKSDWIEAGALAIPTDFTIEAWIRPKSATGETYVLAKDRSGQGEGQFRLGLDASARVFFMMTDSGGDDHGLYGGSYALRSAAIALDAWTHVAVTKSGSSFTLYTGTSSVAIGADAAFAHGGPPVSFRIGGRVAGDGTGLDGGFDGVIDDVRMWSVARTPAEIAATRTTPPATATAGLVVSFRLDEGAGTTTSDAKSGLVATFGGAPAWVVSTAY